MLRSSSILFEKKALPFFLGRLEKGINVLDVSFVPRYCDRLFNVNEERLVSSSILHAAMEANLVDTA